MQESGGKEGICDGDDIRVLGMCGNGGVMGADTQVFYICGQYSLVFVLDLSPNMRAVVGYYWSGGPTKLIAPPLRATPVIV